MGESFRRYTADSLVTLCGLDDELEIRTCIPCPSRDLPVYPLPSSSQLSHSSSFRPEGCSGKTYDAITTGVSLIISVRTLPGLTQLLGWRLHTRRVRIRRQREPHCRRRVSSNRWLFGRVLPCELISSSYYTRRSHVRVQGGGHSNLSPVYGLAADRVVSLVYGCLECMTLTSARLLRSKSKLSPLTASTALRTNVKTKTCSLLCAGEAGPRSAL